MTCWYLGLPSQTLGKGVSFNGFFIPRFGVATIPKPQGPGHASTPSSVLCFGCPNRTDSIQQKQAAIHVFSWSIRMHVLEGFGFWGSLVICDDLEMFCFSTEAFFFKRLSPVNHLSSMWWKSPAIIQSIFTQIVFSSSHAARRASLQKMWHPSTAQLNSYHPWDPMLSSIPVDPSCKSLEVKTRPKRGKVSQSAHTSQPVEPFRFGGRLPSVIHVSSRTAYIETF